MSLPSDAPLPVVLQRIMQIHRALGVLALIELPHARWDYRFGRWRFIFYAGQEPLMTLEHPTTHDQPGMLLPYTVTIWHDGRVVGLVGMTGGAMLHIDDRPGEEAFLQALEVELSRLQEGQP